jgi:hypothetical protein
MVVYDGFWSEYLSYKDVACCGNTKCRLSDCPRPVGTELPVSEAVKIISEQLSLPEADPNKKPVAVYGGLSTGKSTIMSLVFDELKKIEDYRPMIVSLEKPTRNDGMSLRKRHVSACDLLADVIAQQLVHENIGNITEQERDWTNLIDHIDSCTAQQSKKFILLVDDLAFLQYPFELDTEQFITSLFRRQNWCLVFSSCVPVFSMDHLPCVPTARSGCSVSNNDLTEEFYYCAGIPALFHSEQLTSDLNKIRRPPWDQFNFRGIKFSVNAKWPPILQVVDELFVPIPVPRTLQSYSHLSACVADGSVLYWPQFAIAEVLTEYVQDLTVDEISRFAAELVYDTLHARLPSLRPHPELCGFARVWENTVRVSMLLWVIRMNEDPSRIRDFVSRVGGSGLKSVDGAQYRCVQLENVDCMDKYLLYRYLADTTSEAPDESVIVCLFTNSRGDLPGFPIICEYSGMICLKDREGLVNIFGFLTDQSRARCPQPDWITSSVLILPYSQRCDLYREEELRNGRWEIWTDEEVGEHLGFSLQMTDLESAPAQHTRRKNSCDDAGKVTNPSELVAKDKTSLSRLNFSRLTTQAQASLQSIPGERLSPAVLM